MYALFNKEHKFIGFSPDFEPSPNSGIFMREIPDNKFDPIKSKWVGDMKNGKLVQNSIENEVKDGKILP